MEDDSRLSVLIVDDEKSNIDVLNHILKTDYKIYVAKSGNSALKRAAEDKPDLILLDVLMPDMTGFDVLVELKESDVTRDIPVIFITGLTKAEDEEKGFFLGAVDYITKPFNNSIVKVRVKTHLQIVKQIRTIERLGMIDALTDIPNRRSFDNHMNIEWARAIREKTPLGLLMMDVDKFKVYNDTYGHPQGDKLLQIVSKIFVSTLKRPADLAARVGGEEFAAILPNTNLHGVLTIAEEIRANVEATMIPAAEDLITSVTISIGAASIHPSLQETIADFIKKADSALYQAKETGRNKVCH